MFKPANPNSRIPAILQKNTKENIIFQLALTAVFIGGMILKDRAEQRRWEEYCKNYQETPETN